MARKNKKVELLQEVLNINKTSALILNFLITNYNGKTFYSVKQLVKKLNKDRTTIQKCIYPLLLTKVIKSRQTNLTRGFQYEYMLNNKLDLQDFLKDKINEKCDNDIALVNKL